MTQPQENTTHESPTQRIARSLFGFALLASVVAVLSWLGLIVAPVSPDPTYAQLRTVIVVGFGLLTLAIIFFTGWSLMTSEASLLRIATPIARLFRSRLVAVIATFILLEINLVAASALRDVAPTIINSLRLALVGWSLVLVFLIATLHWQNLFRFFQHTSRTWASFGFIVVLLAGLVSLFALTSLVVQVSGINDRLRGGLDYREISFIDDGQQPTSQQFWQEQAQTRVRWQPYVYWVVDTFDGNYINVGADGLRQTVNPTTIPVDALQLGIFGGSTAWGEGSRDAYTIPSQLSIALANANVPMQVTNYAQTGYVSTQDLLLFQSLLLQGKTLDGAVFYGGFNDILSTYSQDYVGLTLQEKDRVSDSEVGRTLRGGQPVIRPISVSLADEDFTLMATKSSQAEAIVDRYLANMRMIQVLAEAYDVQVYFVWQPSIVFKQNLVEGENTAYERMTLDRTGFAELYAQADAILREKIADGNLPILLLSDLFNSDDRAIFYDLIHITEEGNTVVAQAISQYIVGSTQ